MSFESLPGAATSLTNNPEKSLSVKQSAEANALNKSPVGASLKSVKDGDATGGDMSAEEDEAVSDSGEGVLEEAELDEIVSPEEIVPEEELIEVVKQRGSDRKLAKEYFLKIKNLDEKDPEREKIRKELVEMHVALAEYFARRFTNRGELTEDLIQVAIVGLIKSVDRFDPERGVEFSTFAAPTIIGEVKRHFRDKGWAVRVPRRLQEMHLALSRALPELSQDLGRSPTVSELAKKINCSEEDVLEGLEAGQAYTATSLDTPDSDDEERGGGVISSLGSVDSHIEGIEVRESLKPLIAELPERERKILLLRFFAEKTQSQIATELGISQMHVSRILARTLVKLRTGLGEV